MQFDIDGKEMSLRPGMNTYFGKRTSRLTGRCCAILDRIIHNAYRIERRWREHAQTPHARTIHLTNNQRKTSYRRPVQAPQGGPTSDRHTLYPEETGRLSPKANNRENTGRRLFETMASEREYCERLRGFRARLRFPGSEGGLARSATSRQSRGRGHLYSRTLDR